MPDLVSIIIPTYNRAYVLANAIQSLLAQTISDWELIVIDDGSTDTTKKLVSDFWDQRIVYFYQDNSGPSAARNTAFKHVHGKWVAYLDSDNEFFPNYLAVMRQAIQQHPEKLLFLPQGVRTLELIENDKTVRTIDDSADFPEKLSLQDIFLRKMHFDVNGFMHSRQFIDEGFVWDTHISLMEDWDFVMQLGAKYPDRFQYVPQQLFHYHQRFGGDGLVSNGKYLEWAQAFEYIYQKHKDDRLLQGQDWYPDRVIKYKRLHEAELQGKASPPHLRYFS